MPKLSAGLLLYRHHAGALQVLLVHPGGPFFRNKDLGSWTIPKGEPLPHEDPLAAAIRETTEELGSAPTGPYTPLTPIQQKAGKRVLAFAAPTTFDPSTLRSNTFTIEWPPKSGKHVSFPEIDRAEFFPLPLAKSKINPAQVPLLEELEATLNR